MPMPGLPIHTALSAAELRALARRETRPRVAPRLYAIAHVLDGMSRAEAARLCGMERQALRDAVVRFNAQGVDGLVDRPRPGRQPLLSEGEQAALRALVLRGPDPERSGLSSWTLVKRPGNGTLHRRPNGALTQFRCCCAGHAAPMSLASSRSSLARPYICRLIILSRLI